MTGALLWLASCALKISRSLRGSIPIGPCLWGFSLLAASWEIGLSISVHGRRSDHSGSQTQAQVQVPGPNYVLFNNIYSKEDAIRFCTKLGGR